ncbi:putative serine protease PepD [Friedmanniella luteola]|uniref:Putative serine protease PepD n=1 Tax=Friedmanniella luteola TaxID=546871 RepID=A0A1H1NJR6_9ACTN|nr:trypsin-like peptidase domain-containing protein [Friedmanniella luteola]SDR98955.1 putative serine protease PepD [Friedmanniella luteola]
MGENTPPGSSSGGPRPGDPAPQGPPPDEQYWAPFGRPPAPEPAPPPLPGATPQTAATDPHADTDAGADTAPLPVGEWSRPDAWTPRGPGFDTQPTQAPVPSPYAAAPPPWGPPSSSGPQAWGPPPPFSPPAGAGSTALPGPAARRRSRLWPVLALAALTALLVGGAAGYGGSLLAGRGTAGPTVATSAPADPGTSGSARPLPAPPAQADTVEVAKRVLPGTVMIQTGSSTGSGFVLDTAGRIMTNNHVVAGAADGDRIRVVFSDGRRQNATLVGRSPSYDLAVIKVRASEDLEPLPFGDSEAIEVGQPVIAVGAPLGLPGTVTQGIVSAQDRPVVVNGGSDADAPTAYINAIQTDAPINPGNSGGPLVDAAGRVIGVNSAILTLGSSQGQTGNIGLGFAIPVDQARQIGRQLAEKGKASYPVIGATVQDTSSGVQLQTVESGGPADDAGLRQGDVVTRIDDQRVRTMEELIVTIRTRRPGQAVVLDYTRGSADRSARVTLGSKEG